VSARKQRIAISVSSSSFFIAGAQGKPYITPTFQKVIFETEHPPIILVSAVGATGKTALAEQLSRDIGLPLFDLAKHKPVGDNTLTGLLTSAFEVRQISAVLEGLASGTFGVIIDGVDEGRSKTNEKAFEAFLDDIARLCNAESGPTFVMLGRTQILDDCWTYLSAQGVPAALITIAPFTIAEAKLYIDTFTGNEAGASGTFYTTARDAILDKLGKAFAGAANPETAGFLSFIGYPPVLDAIVTLLTEEPNYHKLIIDLGAPEGQNVEISLLNRIAQYILRREREDKIVPNILQPLLEEVPGALRQRALAEAFSTEEQCVRLVAHCLNRPMTLSSLREPVLDEQYEAQLATVLIDHPFITGRTFRNAVFEASTLATLMTSTNDEYLRLATDYLSTHKHSYYLVYMLDITSAEHRISIEMLGPLFTAAMEFRSVRSLVELRINGPDLDGDDLNREEVSDIDIEIDILLGIEQNESQTFAFRAEITTDSRLQFGSILGGAFISVPCAVELGGAQELELIAPIEITASTVTLDARTLILRTAAHHQNGQPEVIINSRQLDTLLATITTNGIPLIFAVADTKGITYPAIQYAERTPQPPADPLLRHKYFRFRRIIMEFRSHSRGALARYRYKIESERVLKGNVGAAVLARLVHDGILSLRGSMYYLDPEKLSAHVGVSWQDLRKGKMPDALGTYLRTVT
jgi:hypothetical protein